MSSLLHWCDAAVSEHQDSFRMETRAVTEVREGELAGGTENETPVSVEEQNRQGRRTLQWVGILGQSVLLKVDDKGQGEWKNGREVMEGGRRSVTIYMTISSEEEKRTMQDGTMWRNKGPEFSGINNIGLQKEGAREVMNRVDKKNISSTYTSSCSSHLTGGPPLQLYIKWGKAWQRRGEKANRIIFH